MIKLAADWTDYEIIATGGGQKLERWGSLILLRPDPQIIWEPPFDLQKYAGLTAAYGKTGWSRTYGKPFEITYKGMKFMCKLQGFKHTGLFPEQAANWDRLSEICKPGARVLNLFAYTGAATVTAALAGAHVTHVDASKGMVERAKQNCALSGVNAKNTRFIVDDCLKFVQREARRGCKYDAVVMDPPSYGRGTNGEVWKLEDTLFALVKATGSIINSNPLFCLINSYTTGLSPTVMGNIIKIVFGGGGAQENYELGLPTSDRGIVLPCGSSSFHIWK